MQLQMHIRIQAEVCALSRDQFGISGGGNHRGVVCGQYRRGEVYWDILLREARSEPIPQLAIASDTAGDENGMGMPELDSS